MKPADGGSYASPKGMKPADGGSDASPEGMKPADGRSDDAASEALECLATAAAPGG